jgi:hypothetical protein
VSEFVVSFENTAEYWGKIRRNEQNGPKVMVNNGRRFARKKTPKPNLVQVHGGKMSKSCCAEKVEKKCRPRGVDAKAGFYLDVDMILHR